MRNLVLKPNIKGTHKIADHNRVKWVLKRGRDYQLMLTPNPNIHTEFNFLPSHRGPRTTLAGRHH